MGQHVLENILSEANRKMQLMSVEKLVPNGYNPNHMNEEDFSNLVESIRNAGFLEDNPILARPINNGSFEIVDGEHRWKASKQLGIKEVPCMIREISDMEARRQCVILNKDRGAPDYFKLSKIFNEDYSKGNITQEEIGIQYGFAKKSVNLILPIYPRLVGIKSLTCKTFSNRDLMQLARVENHSFRAELVKRAVNMSSSDIQDAASKINKITKLINEKTNNPELKEQAINKLLENGLIFNEIDIEELKSFAAGIVDKPVRYAPQLIVGDPLRETKILFPHPIRLILTAPNYGDLENYGDDNQVTSKKGLEKYLKMLEDLWSNCFDLLVPGGRLVLVVADAVKATGTVEPHRVEPIHAYIMKQCLDIGYELVDSAIWYFKNKNIEHPGSIPYPPEFLINRDHAEILILMKPGYTLPASEAVKESSRLSDMELRQLDTNVWEIPKENGVAFPERLAELLIKLYSYVGECVLDPFCVNGITCISSMKLNRKSIGIDSNEKNIKNLASKVNRVIEQENNFRYIGTI